MENSANKNQMKCLFKYFNPATLSDKDLNEVSILYAFVISGLTYGLFFLQTGLDQKRIGNKTLIEVIVLALKGLAIGTLGLTVLSVIVFIIMKIFKGECLLVNLIKVFCLSYTTALLSLVFGFIFNVIFHTNTAIAFGVTGVLWSLNPLFRVLRKNTKGNLSLSLTLCTTIGLLILITWHVLV